MQKKTVKSRSASALRGSRARSGSVVPIERIEHAILLVRGHKVILSGDLAAMYGVAVKVFVQAVKRHADRFPPDFMFHLTLAELRFLRSQFVTLNGTGSEDARGRHPKYPPYAFTEQGVAMLSSVLNSPRAVAVNIEIMRAFVRLRQILASHADLARRLDELEQRYDAQFKVVFDAIRELMKPRDPEPVPRIGFITDHCLPRPTARSQRSKRLKPRRASPASS